MKWIKEKYREQIYGGKGLAERDGSRKNMIPVLVESAIRLYYEDPLLLDVSLAGWFCRPTKELMPSKSKHLPKNFYPDYFEELKDDQKITVIKLIEIMRKINDEKD